LVEVDRQLPGDGTLPLTVAYSSENLRRSSVRPVAVYRSITTRTGVGKVAGSCGLCSPDWDRPEGRSTL